MKLYKVLIVLAAITLLGCGNGDNIQQTQSVESQAEFQLNGAIQSTEIFGKEDPGESITVVRCEVADDGAVSFSTYELIGTEDLSQRVPRLIQFYDPSNVLATGGLGTLSETTAQHIDVVVSMEQGLYELKGSHNCFVSYLESDNVNAVQGQINCPKLTNSKNTLETLSLKGDFTCDRTRGQLDLQLIDKDLE